MAYGNSGTQSSGNLSGYASANVPKTLDERPRISGFQQDIAEQLQRAHALLNEIELLIDRCDPSPTKPTGPISAGSPGGLLAQFAETLNQARMVPVRLEELAGKLNRLL